MEVSLFVGPRATFDIGSMALTPVGKIIGPKLRGADHNNSDRDATWIFVASMRDELKDVYSKVGPQ